MNKPNFNNTLSEEIIEPRYRHFMFLLYPEDSNYNEVLQDIKTNFKNWAYITHKPEEEEKKEHTHVILSLDNTRTIESICKRLEVPTRLCQRVRGLRGACRYLVHKDNEEKLQYDLTDVVVSKSFSSKFYGAFDDLLSDNEMLSNIYDFIDEHKNCSSIELEVMLTQFVCSVNYERVFKRYYNTISKYIYYITDSSNISHNI